MICARELRAYRRSLPGIVLACFLLSWLLLGSAGQSFGQTETATLSGTITDQTGALMPGVRVTVTNEDTNITNEGITTGAGVYSIPGLRPGRYRMSVEKDGFKRVSIRDIVLNVQDVANRNFTLQVGGTSETVQVEGGIPLVNTESAAVSTVVDRRFVENMPLNGRSFQSLIALVPGVVAPPGAPAGFTGFKGEFSINGQRTEANYYTVDGVSANTGATPSNIASSLSGTVPAGSALGTTQSLVSLDALQEFRIQTSTYLAEYGRTPGGQISFVTRSGTNEWHGSAFDYLRNGVLDANNWFNNASGLAKTSERQNDFGGTLGGPLFVPHLYNGHNRTFFFFSYEGLRLSTPVAALTKFVPDLCLRGNAALCTGTDTPAPIALRPILNAYTLPNGPFVLGPNGQPTGMAQFTSAFSTPGTIDSTSIRIDHNINSKFTLFGRYSDAPSQTLTRSNGTPALSDPATTSSMVKTLTLGTTNLPTSHLGNELRFNYTWNDTQNSQSLDSFGGAVPFTAADIKDFNGQPTPGVTGFSLLLAFGGNAQMIISNSKTQQRQANIVDTLSYSFGRHSLKFGVDYRQLRTPLTMIRLLETASFSSKAQVQQNVAPSIGVTSSQSFPMAPVYKNLSFFGQDSWQAWPRLSLSFGLRWDLNPPPSDAFGNLPYTLNQTTNLATAAVAPKGTPLWNTSYKNFAPRVGAAYKLRDVAGWETVMRGGFGVFYDLGNTYASQGYFGIGIGVTRSLTNLPFPLTSGQLTLPAPSIALPYNSTVYAFDPNLQVPYTLQWNVAFEQGLSKGQALTISYVGSASRKLLMQRQLRPALLGNPNFTSTGIANLVLNRATSDYDAMQAQFQRRLSHGLQVLAFYTWSHSIDEASLNSVSVKPLLRGSSDFDVRHNFQAAVTYDIPGSYANLFASALLRHWALDTRVVGRSSLPLDVVGGSIFDPATGTQLSLRADLVAGQPIYISDATAPGGRRVNFNAFTIPTTAEIAVENFGNAPRNFLRGFDDWQVDLAVRREFPIHERLKLQFRAEAFNLFNHPIFGSLQTSLTTGAAVFGRATGTLNTQLGGLNALYQQGGPRSLQLSLRLAF